METIEFHSPFQNISQRAACSYLKSLSEFAFVMPEGLGPQQQGEMEASQRDLHEFFKAFYEKLYQSPDLFGLPVSEDIYF